jgi:hypothetical protein
MMFLSLAYRFTDSVRADLVRFGLHVNGALACAQMTKHCKRC